MMSSRIFLRSVALLPLLVGPATARYYESLSFNDAACEDLNSTMIVDGILAMTGVNATGIQAFGECSVLTDVNDYFGSSMYECTDNEATVSYYAGDSCSGEAVMSDQATNSTCSDSATSRCTENSDLSILTNWVVEATFYSDANCSMASGETGQYTMAEVLELTVNGTCQEVGFSSSSSSSSSTLSVYAALRCVDGYVGVVMYDESDTTCSGDFVMVSTDADNCETSIFDEGPYAEITCSADFDGASSLQAVGGGSYCWSIAAAAAATVLAAVFG